MYTAILPSCKAGAVQRVRFHGEIRRIVSSRIPCLAMWMLIRDLVLRAGWAPTLVFAVHLYLWKRTSLYLSFPFIDIPLHLLGGFAIAYFFSGLLGIGADRKLVDPVRGGIRFLLLVSLTCMAGVIWEFAELGVDRHPLLPLQLGLEDTLGDILVGTVGGALYGAAERL